ncbi:RiPP maturation radical SAM C-methyltransferase [Kitasatospora sp. NPDC018058]|uniref:RiPP maturation radical SAM C-methyltransferase n=1 Tax=Kitasatospora sp. NPDC018058 TaxID=3364025 RepID=UPI0037C16A8C
MPWQLLELPSLAIGILRRRVAQTRPEAEVSEVHAAMDWAGFLLAESGGDLTPHDYTHVAETGLHHGLGDWVFAGVLYDDDSWREFELIRYAKANDVDIEVVRRMRPYARPFVERVVDELLSEDPDVVGFTTTFMQNVPSFAVARLLKQRRPAVRTVMGGANCDGPMGASLHRNHHFVDFAVRGEGELAFPALLDHIAADTPPLDVPGLCWWDGDRPVANPESAAQVPPGLIPTPDYTDWQRALQASPTRTFVEPKLAVEGARGCWWGEKHQCTFCGLNGSAIAFRSKDADAVWQEVSGLIERHRILDLVMVDNILDMGYFRDLLPRMAASGWDLRVHYEVKSNLRPDQLDLLAAAGVVHIQPGIESLNARVLDLMDKGVGGARNVSLLRDCHDRGLTVSWNYLYGFPGERDADYGTVIDQMPALVHLQPPGATIRIALERFSPNFERPELGFAERAPSRVYDHIYDLPPEELADLVYLFDTPPQGIRGEIEARLHRAVEAWQAAHTTSSLVMVADVDDEVRIADRRHGWPSRDHLLRGLDAAVYRLTERVRTAPSVLRALAEQGRQASEDEVAAALAGLRERGLVYCDGEHVVALAVRDLPARVSPTRMSLTPLAVVGEIPVPFPEGAE